MSNNLMETMSALLSKTTDDNLNINQLLAFMSLSNTMGALNLAGGSQQGKTIDISALENVIKGEGSEDIQGTLNSVLNRGGNKTNVNDLLGLLGSVSGQNSNSKINPQLLMSLMSMLSQTDKKKSAEPSAEEISKDKEESRDKKK